MKNFRLISSFKPAGDQKQAIERLTEGIFENANHQVLLGVTGSGKTFTMANVIANVQRPTLVISHNKTLAAQLYSEFRQFFPENAVEYFVSYYDYYQPEAYIPQTDTYIEKDSSINDEIDRLRLSATSAILERRDVIVVASVSCIFGLGSPSEWRQMILLVNGGDRTDREEILQRLVNIQYERNDIEFVRGRFRVRGDVVEVFPAHSETAVRIELFGDTVERISRIHPVTGEVLEPMERLVVYPAKHFVTSAPRLEEAIRNIKQELDERLAYFATQGKLLEAQRLESRTHYDLEILREIGYCAGIENYSRHLSGRKPGERPAVLLDYFPEDFLVIIDESHATIPQLRGMFAGDRSRKEVLVGHGFRLPSALDNRPLTFGEFSALVGQVVYVSATPAEYELSLAEQVVEQIIRPTGLIDPKISVRSTRGQIDDLISEIKKRVEKQQRVLVTTLTKRMAEDLTEYLLDLGLKVHYLHSEIETIERVEILRDLRLGKYDVVVGINLLREGLDLPEVSLVAVLDADKEGFLRSETSLIQVSGRAARNVDGEVIMYADTITESMRRAINETNRRRETQVRFNEEHSITPQSIKKTIDDIMQGTAVADAHLESVIRETRASYATIEEVPYLITDLEREMQQAVKKLEFEQAAALRDQIAELRQQMTSLALPPRRKIRGKERIHRR